MPRHLEDTLIGSIYGSRNIDKILIEKAGIYMEISYFDGKNVKGNPARTIGPKTVFHYTSPNNFMSIFKDNKLWFSDCQFMNDKSEYVYIKKVFLKAIKGANIEVNTEKNERFIDYLLPPYNNIRIERQKKGLIVKNCIKIKRYYLLCTSLKRDSHSLWCYYSKNNHYQGYNFGINTEKFINSMRGILPNEGCKITYGKVIYDEEEQVRQIKEYKNSVDVAQKSADISSRIELQRDKILNDYSKGVISEKQKELMLKGLLATSKNTNAMLSNQVMVNAITDDMRTKTKEKLTDAQQQYHSFGFISADDQKHKKAIEENKITELPK